MLFSVRDIDALRFLRWCRYAAPDDMARMFGDVTMANLKTLRFIHTQKSGGVLTLTGKGNEFLDALLPGIPSEVSKTYKEKDIRRRVRVSKIALTAYRAGFSVFSNQIEDLRCSSSLFLPAIARGRGANPWSSSRIAAIVRIGDTLGSIHYVCPGIGKILLTDELTTFSNNTSRIGNVRRVLLFGGESYRDILAELEALPEQQDKGKEDGRLTSYGDACQKINMAVHLLPCDDTGALQLRLMSQKDYRRRLTEAALRSQYQPPPQEHPEWDAIFQGTPFVMAADMNLRRVQRAINAAQECGLMPIAMVALKEQAEAVLNTRYRNTSLARVFMLSPKALGEVVDPTLHEPPARAFLTKGGDTADVPLI